MHPNAHFLLLVRVWLYSMHIYCYQYFYYIDTLKGYLDGVSTIYVQLLKFLCFIRSHGNERILKGWNIAEGLFNLDQRNKWNNSWKLARIKNLKRYICFTVSISTAHLWPRFTLHFVLHYHFFPLRCDFHWDISVCWGLSWLHWPSFILVKKN